MNKEITERGSLIFNSLKKYPHFKIYPFFFEKHNIWNLIIEFPCLKKIAYCQLCLIPGTTDKELEKHYAEAEKSIFEFIKKQYDKDFEDLINT